MILHLNNSFKILIFLTICKEDVQWKIMLLVVKNNVECHGPKLRVLVLSWLNVLDNELPYSRLWFCDVNMSSLSLSFFSYQFVHVQVENCGAIEELCIVSFVKCRLLSVDGSYHPRAQKMDSSINCIWVCVGLGKSVKLLGWIG